MVDSNVFKLAQPGTFTDSLTEILRSGARALLTQAVEAEVGDFLHRHADLKTEAGRRRLVRHGHLPEREIMTGIGPVAVRQPRLRDRAVSAGERIRFNPAILPPYARRTKSLEVLIPILYLKGISTGDFEEVLAALVGKNAPGLSASTLPASRRGGPRSTSAGRSAISPEALRLLVGRRHSPAGSARRPSPMHSRHHRSDAGGQEGAGRLYRRHARERLIVARSAA